jgi:hypothetical protein
MSTIPFCSQATSKISKTSSLVEKESNVAGFLGVHIERLEDGSLHHTQKGLEATNVEKLTPARAPAARGVLPKDEEVIPRTVSSTMRR